MIEVSPFDKEIDLLDKIKKSSYDKVLVLRLNNFIFDGVMKVEYIETVIYAKNGETIYTKRISNKIPLGSSGKVKKTVPENMKSIFEDILNNHVLIE